MQSKKLKLVSLVHELSLTAQELGAQDYISNKDDAALPDWKIAVERHKKAYSELITAIKEV